MGKIKDFLSNRIFKSEIKSAVDEMVKNAWAIYHSETFDGNDMTVAKSPHTLYDLEAKNVNSSVGICIRAIDDAIKQLPPLVMEIDVSEGSDREIPDEDHELGILLQRPSENYSWRNIISYTVKSFLLDGNGYIRKDRVSIPGRLQLVPECPTQVSAVKTGQIITEYSIKRTAQDEPDVYPAEEIIHIKDISPEDPVYGKSRFESVREEIQLEHDINRLNINFFKNGAILNLMFNPDVELKEDQHKQLMEVFKSRTQGLDNAFKLFVNRYPGKLESLEQKHKEIAFIEALRICREKIFGQFGVPPFLAGVMEYANYANALVQDRSFWNNTIKPIVSDIEDAINHQLTYHDYDEDHVVRLDTSGVPALQGDPIEKMQIHTGYVNAGILTKDEVRAELNYEPLPEAADEEPAETPAEPAEEEEEEATNAVYRFFRQHRKQVLSGLYNQTKSGNHMWAIIDTNDLSQYLDTYKDGKAFKAGLMPILKRTIHNRGENSFRREGVRGAFNVHTKEVQTVLDRLEIYIDAELTNICEYIKSCLRDCKKFDWDFSTLKKNIKRIYKYDRAKSIAKKYVMEVVNQSSVISKEQATNNHNGNGPIKSVSMVNVDYFNRINSTKSSHIA